MIIELDINGARVIISGDNLTVNVTQDGEHLPALNISKPQLLEGRQIKALRKKLGLRQHQFCDLLGVTQGTVSRWETGVETPRGPAAIMLVKLAEDAA